MSGPKWTPAQQAAIADRGGALLVSAAAGSGKTAVLTERAGETAEDIARASFVSKPGILLGGDLNIIYPNSAIEPTFLALSISNGEQQKSLAKKAQGKSVVHLHNSDLETVQITYPTREEQRQIGAYFRTLDHLITLHQRKPFQHTMEVIIIAKRC